MKYICLKCNRGFTTTKTGCRIKCSHCGARKFVTEDGYNKIKTATKSDDNVIIINGINERS
jgi:DNA-directed RNA polymerase subunit RPC12/RpoP